MLPQSSTMFALSTAAAAGRCSRAIWTAAAAAAESLGAAAASSTGGGQAAAASSPAITQLHNAADVQPTHQEQQQQFAMQQQLQPQQQVSSLHEQVLYQMPPRGQPLPQLPRFLPRKAVQQPLSLKEALTRVKSSSRDSATIEAHLRLKVDPRRGDQMVRGAAVLPHSWQTGLRIAVFAEGRAADEARAAGADIVGSEALVASILDSKGKAIDFTACLATPDMMPQLVRLGRILGPKGLMPNPKMGTLTDDVAGAISELRQGRVEFKMDRTGIIHAPIGKVGFDPQALYLNMGALTAALMSVKPEAVKGGLQKFVRGVHLASTMGPSVPVDVGSLSAAMGEAAAALRQKKAGDATADAA